MDQNPRFLYEKNINFTQIGKQNRFVYAAETGDNKSVQELLDIGIDPNTENFLGESALRQAAFNGHVTTIELLLFNGAHIHAKDAKGKTAIMYAALNNQLETVNLLIEKGGSVEVVCLADMTALGYAYQNNHQEMALRLLGEMSSEKIKDTIQQFPNLNILFDHFKQMHKINLEEKCEMQLEITRNRFY